MTLETLQQGKEKIAQMYIDSFKKELTSFQVNLFVRFEEKMKELLLSTDYIGDSFDDLPFTDEEKKILSDDPLLARKAYLFIKEKREMIAKAKTIDELTMLSSELNTQEGKKINALRAGITTSVIGGGAVVGTYKIHDWIDIGHTKKMKSLFNEGVKETKLTAANAKESFIKMQSQFDDLSKNLTTYSKNPKLTGFMKRNLRKSAKVFENTAKGLTEESISAFEMWSKLGQKLPYSVIKSIKPEQAKALMGLTEESFNIIKNTDNLDDIRKSLKLGDLSDETLKVLKTAKNLDEFKGMTHCLTQVKSIKTVLKGIRGIALLDLIALGVDVWCYGESMNEIEEEKKLNALKAKYMKQRANAQLGIGIAGTVLSVGIGIIASCTVIGSIVPGFGTIVGLAVGGIIYGVSRIVDSYYENVEFYAQNEENYKKQYRTKIKQAIIQTTSAESFGRHEGIREDIELERAEKGQSINYVEDAWRALIWQEEMNNNTYPQLQDFKNSDKSEDEYLKELLEGEGGKEKVEAYDQEKKKIDAIINKRLAYIQNYMYKTGDSKKVKEFVSAMTGSQGLVFVEKILAESKVYYLKSDQSENQYIPGFEKKSVKEYTTAFGEKLKKENPVFFEKLSSLCKNNFNKFVELYQGTVYLESKYTDEETSQQSQEKPVEDVFAEEPVIEDVFAEEPVVEDELAEEPVVEDELAFKDPLVKENIAYIKRFYEYATLGVSIERLHSLKLAFNDVDYNYIERTLLDINSLDKASVFTANDTKIYFTGDAALNRYNSNIETSDDIGQDVLYRLAREFHGYTGNNDMMQLMQFYNPNEANSTGIYYDGGWYINNDWAIDKSFDLAIFNDSKKSSQDILKELTNASKWNYIPMFLTPSPMPLADMYGYMDFPSSIDTPTENMDDEMNQEFWKRFARIIEEEKGKTSPKEAKTIEQEILSYVKENIKNNGGEGYVELPYYLIIKAKKAGIGDLSPFLFSYKNTSLVVCSNKANIDQKITFSHTKTPIIKEYVQNVREEFTPEEKKYIDYVEKSHDKLEELRNMQGLWTHEDDLDLPRDFEIIISDKWKQWEHLKKSMLACEPGIAVNDILKREYAGYHDYFENLYMGLLSEVSSHKFTNDIDGYSYVMSVVLKMEGGFFKLEDKKLLEEILPEGAAPLFYKQLETVKIENKTIYELYKSEDVQDKQRATWAAKQILKSILEALVLDVDDNGKIEDINSGSNYLKLHKNYPTILLNNLKNNKFFIPPEITSTTITSLSSEQLQIKKVEKNQTKTMDKTKDVLKEIEATAVDVVWQGKRGEISFDPEHNTLSSWGNTTSIEIIGERKLQMFDITRTYVKIKGLDMELPLKQGIWVANFVNRIKYKYPGHDNGFHFGSRGYSGLQYGIYARDGFPNTRIIKLDTIKENCNNILDSDNDVETEFIRFINSL